MLRAGEQIGPYTLVSKLGRGAFGTVWLSERRTSLATTTAALKIPLDDEVDLETIKREADVWVRASGHPNVLPIIEANIYEDQIVIASEYAPDGSLESWLKQNGGRAPSIDAAVEIIIGVLSGLEHLHKRNIIHRDLKPANILFQGNTPRLADFGISRVLRSTSQSSIVAGTPVYMAPEAFDGKRNEKTDVWSVGVILYQMIAGKLPFPQGDISSLIGAILRRNPDPLPLTVPRPLNDVIICALAKDPNQRFQSAAEMRSALRHLAETPNTDRKEKIEFSTSAGVPGRRNQARAQEAPPAGQASKPHIIYALSGLVAVLIVVVGLVFLLRNSNSNNPSTDSSVAPTQIQPSATINPSANVQSPAQHRFRPKITSPSGPMLGGLENGLYYKNYTNSLEEGVAYKYANSTTVYIYDGRLLRPVATGEAYFKFYGCKGNMRLIDCAPVYEMPASVTPEMLKGEIMQ